MIGYESEGKTGGGGVEVVDGSVGEPNAMPSQVSNMRRYV